MLSSSYENALFIMEKFEFSVYALPVIRCGLFCKAGCVRMLLLLLYDILF